MRGHQVRCAEILIQFRTNAANLPELQSQSVGYAAL